MVRTQIYLTIDEVSKLKLLAGELGKKQSEIIREAIDCFLLNFSKKDQLKRLQNAKGMWKDRSKTTFKNIRNELNQRTP